MTYQETRINNEESKSKGISIHGNVCVKFSHDATIRYVANQKYLNIYSAMVTNFHVMSHDVVLQMTQSVLSFTMATLVFRILIKFLHGVSRIKNQESVVKNQ